MAEDRTPVLDDEFDDIDFETFAGAEAAEEASKSQGGGLGRRWVTLDQLIKGGEAAKKAGEDRVHLRYLTDYENRDGELGWMVANVHTAVPTKDKPASLDKDQGWPQKLTAVCRNSPSLVKATGGDCWICENVMDPYRDGQKHSAPARTFALAVLRKPIYGDGTEENGGPRMKGKIVNFDDVTVEVPALDENGEVVKDKNGNLVTEVVPQYVVVRQAYSNFFQSLRSQAETFGTALDRDYLVIREGEKKDTNYTHIAMSPIRFKDEESGAEIDLDMSNPDLRDALYGDRPPLRQIITDMATNKYYRKWYIPSEDDDAASGSTGTVAAPKAASREQSEDAVNALRDRLRKRRSGGED